MGLNDTLLKGLNGTGSAFIPVVFSPVCPCNLSKLIESESGLSQVPIETPGWSETMVLGQAGGSVLTHWALNLASQVRYPAGANIV